MANESKQAAGVLAGRGGAFYLHRFETPLLYDGREITELGFDFDRLTGGDSLAVENELEGMGKLVISPVFSGEYAVRICARACQETVGADIFTRMPWHDYNRIRSAARSFLLQLGSSSETAADGSDDRR